MDESTYIHPASGQMTHSLSSISSLSRDSSMPEDQRSSPATSAYTHDIPTTYPSVAPFNSYSGPYDSSLPTPVSVAGSPSMNERTSSKIMHAYNQHRASSQQPTPPNTSRPWPNYQMSATPDLLEMSGLDASHSPGQHGQMVSEPPFHNNWGQYSVSQPEPQEELPPHLQHPPIFSIAPGDLNRTISMHPAQMPLPAHVPLLQNSPDPRDLPPSVAIDSMHHQYPNMMPHQPHVIMDFATPYRRKTTKARNGRSGRPPKRRAHGRPLEKRGDMDYVDPQLQSGEGSPSARPPRRRITLRPDAPEKDQYILELRCQMDGDKGKGIWEEITKKYEQRYGKRRQESLQMNLTRAVLKYAVWPKEEDEALLRAAEEVDRRRYTEIAKVMKEKYGGCQAWEWKEGHILKRLVDLGVEEFDPEDVTKKPRRKKKMMKRGISKQQWTTPSINLPFDEDGRTISSEQENYILDHYCKADPDSDPDAMHGMMEHSNFMLPRGSMERDAGESRSERVAKQACDQLLSKNEHIYGAIPMGDNRH
ncbi:hypothetical protein M426DRAFT_27551 [Hypoxylon sp. CI-4A]|nr:hypothetical protein M426DRAFT_27551 [Hypoxylon sp. CI-4A]